jgi:hypothetical protein
MITVGVDIVYSMTGVPASCPPTEPCTVGEMVPVILPDDDGSEPKHQPRPIGYPAWATATTQSAGVTWTADPSLGRGIT